MTFWLMLWEEVAREKVLNVPSLFISNSSQAHSYVCTHFPFWLWEHLGKFWPVSLGVSWEGGQFEARTACFFDWQLCWCSKQMSSFADVYVQNQCPNSSCTGIAMCVDREEEKEERRERGEHLNLKTTWNFIFLIWNWVYICTFRRYIGNKNFSLELIDFNSNCIFSSVVMMKSTKEKH